MVWTCGLQTGAVCADRGRGERTRRGCDHADGCGQVAVLPAGGLVDEQMVEIFLKDRADKPRWYPESEDEFQNWCEETTHLESESAKALD